MIIFCDVWFIPEETTSEYVRKTSECPANVHVNRPSIMSESGKNSSESVEILSGDTGCTTSPDSDAFSVSTPSSTQGTAPLPNSVYAFV